MTSIDFEWLATVDYRTALNVQRSHHEAVVAGEPDRVLLLEHPPVFTCGRRTEAGERPVDAGGVTVIDVDRGGKVTFHGPGQLVGYPIVRLPALVYVVDYVRRLEEALIRTCADLGLVTVRVPGRTGVWVRDSSRSPDRKVAAIGVRVSKKVASHGFSLNCANDLGWYDRFLPCGIGDAGVTSLSKELGRTVTVNEVMPLVREHLTHLLAWEPYQRLTFATEPARA